MLLEELHQLRCANGEFFRGDGQIEFRCSDMIERFGKYGGEIVVASGNRHSTTA